MVHIQRVVQFPVYFTHSARGVEEALQNIHHDSHSTYGTEGKNVNCTHTEQNCKGLSREEEDGRGKEGREGRDTKRNTHPFNGVEHSIDHVRRCLEDIRPDIVQKMDERIFTSQSLNLLLLLFMLRTKKKGRTESVLFEQNRDWFAQPNHGHYTLMNLPPTQGA